MSDILFFVTHPEVVADPKVPVSQWPLSDRGRRRMLAFAEALRSVGVAAIWTSAERKARDGADILGETLCITPKVDSGLGENDRASTGYIAPPEFWLVVEEFFTDPGVSVRGWETAINAQRRIVDAVTRIAASAVEPGPTIIISHGGVGRLLTAHLQGVKIGLEDRPENPGGGCFLTVDRARLAVRCRWRDIEAFNDSDQS